MKDSSNPYTTIAALRDEVADLRWRLHEMEEAFCGPLPLLWHMGLTKAEARLLGALYRRNGLITRRALHIATGGMDNDTQEKIIDVQLSHLRKKLASRGLRIEIETIRSVGYRLTPAARAAIRSLILPTHRQLDKRGSLYEWRRAG